MEMIRERSDDVTRRLRRRLRREMGYWVLVLGATVPPVIYDPRPRSLGIAAALALVIGGIAATLRLGSRRLERVEVDGSVAAVLRRRLAAHDATMRAYMAAYLLCFVLFVGVVGAVTLLRRPWDWRWIAPVGIGAAAVLAWGRSSGRGYVRRHFGRYREELARCLERLEGR